MHLINEKWAAGLLILGMAAPAPVFADSVGQVIRLNPVVSVLREGKTIPLGVKDEIHLNDLIQTDKTGKVQVFFRDDSSVTIGNNSRARMKEFVPDGKNARFGLDMAQGVARVITGKIVEKNPKGFAITTPEATVGIRGTILVVNSTNGQTTVFVENTMKEVFVNGILVPSGFKLTLPSDSHTPQPITDGDKKDIDEANTVASGSNNVITTEDSILNVDAGSLGDIPLSIQSLGDNDSLVIGLATPTTGHVSGTLAITSGGAGSGVFSFDVGLSTGSITNAAMSASGSLNAGTPGVSSFVFSGGSGTLNNISNFVLDSATPAGLATAVYSGSATMSFPPAIPNIGDTINGSFTVDFSTDSGPDSGSGTATGTRTQ